MRVGVLDSDFDPELLDAITANATFAQSGLLAYEHVRQGADERDVYVFLSQQWGVPEKPPLEYEHVFIAQPTQVG